MITADTTPPTHELHEQDCSMSSLGWCRCETRQVPSEDCPECAEEVA